MNEQKEMPKASLNPKFRYWTTPPELLTLKVADIEPCVPKANWKSAPPVGLTVDLPAGKVFSKNVPRISLRALAKLLPDLISASDGVVRLPISKLAASYRLVEHQEELIPEPEPEPLPEPQKLAEPESADASSPVKTPDLPAEPEGVVEKITDAAPPLTLRPTPSPSPEIPAPSAPQSAELSLPAIPLPVTPPAEPAAAPASTDFAPVPNVPEQKKPAISKPSSAAPSAEPVSVSYCERQCPVLGTLASYLLFDPFLRTKMDSCEQALGWACYKTTVH